MQEYRFSMEKVLDWRSDQEDAAQRFVKEKEDRVSQEEDKLNRIISESRRLKNENLFHKSVDHLKRQNLYKDLLDDKIIKQRLALQTAEQELITARNQLKEAHKDKKVMQKLQEKEHTRFKDTLKKKEQSQLDEIATLSFGRPSLY
ncbi:MAG: flagellar export protein FliJ [Alkalibacterium sp.]|nr:flagellar export protein FliJ [Alkalibacterium sp.]